MFRYALKRLVRGRSLFLPLFMSVVLAGTLFSGILQAADTVGASMLNNALAATDVDIVSSAEERNLTRVALAEVKEAISMLPDVESVEHLFRSIQMGPGEGMEANVTYGVNASMPFTVVALPGNSTLIKGILGVDDLEYGKIYVDQGSVNASQFQVGSQITLSVGTYIPGASIILLERRYHEYTVGDVVEVDDRLYSIAIGQYSRYLRSIVTGVSTIGKRQPHQLIFISEETFLDWMQDIYGEWRRHTRVIIAETVIRLDRQRLLNPWSISESADRVEVVFNRVNGIGGSFWYVPVNYLGYILNSVETLSNDMRMTTILIATPVFFTAWYLGQTVSGISLSSRRRETALLFTRGMTHRQVFYIFLFEAFIVSVLAGLSGIVLGAAILPLVIPGLEIMQVVASISPVTLIASFVFTCAISLMAVYTPAQKAIQLNIVDALREYQSEEAEGIGSWHEPALALFLGLYRIAMLLMHLSVEQFRPESADLIMGILYSTWWGVDFILSYIAPILLFWGFTKLFIQYVPWYNDALGRLAGAYVGDITLFSTLSARRNVKRTVASAFIATLILGYSVAVIGGLAGAVDYSERLTRLTVGADASAWLFTGEDADEVRDRILRVEGVAAATVEKWFEAESNVGEIPCRQIQPLEFADVAYMEEGWLTGENVFRVMNGTKYNAIMEKGIGYILQVPMGGGYPIKLGNTVYTFFVTGLFGRDPGPSWALQNPTLYISDTFYLKDKFVKMTRILVRFEEGADLTGIGDRISAADPDIESVDVAEELLKAASSNIFIVGPSKVGELGVYFAAVVSSVGILIIISTAMRARWKEITVMAIRGFSSRQLAITLLVEQLGVTLISVVVGVGIGFIMIRGETAVINATVPSVLPRNTMFPPSAQLALAAVVGLLIVSTVVPILLAVRNASNNPTWRTYE